MLIELFEKNGPLNIRIGRARLFGDRGCYQLDVDGQRWMSYITYIGSPGLPGSGIQKAEQISSYELAYGDCIVSGLGFGIIANWISTKPEVKSVKVYEISEDVIEINNQYNILHEKIEVIHGSIEKAKGQKCDCLLLDHYEKENDNHIILDAQNLSKIIDCNLVWFWRIETIIVEWIFMDRNYRTMELSEFMTLYKQWRTYTGISKLPDISEDKLLEYLFNWPMLYNIELTDDKKMITISKTGVYEYFNEYFPDY
jgi:hypothetical protein